MKTGYIRDAVVTNENGELMSLRYFTTANNGVGIHMKTKTQKGVIKESKISDKLFKSHTEAKAFVDLIYDGLVTPCTLQDIIDDIL